VSKMGVGEMSGAGVGECRVEPDGSP
jgi:hypothetical protein